MDVLAVTIVVRNRGGEEGKGKGGGRDGGTGGGWEGGEEAPCGLIVQHPYIIFMCL